MIDKVRKILGLSSRKTGNKLVLSVEKLESRVALLENGRLEEYSVERKSSRNIVGSVYKGKVKNIEMGLKAMFVDIGFEKNAFLHFWDAIPAALDSGIEEIDRPRGRQPKKRITAKDIPSIYPVGSDVIVQVTKGPIGTKGPRVSTNLSFAGRYLVFMPYSDRSGISRKIEDPKERDRLRKILRSLEIPEGVGVIIRTVGEGQRARYFVRDLSMLVEQWARVEELIKNEPAPCRVFEEPERPTGGLRPDERAAETGQGKDPRAAALGSWPDGDDAPTRPGKPERFHLRELPVLPGPRRGENVDDHQRRTAPDAQHRDAKISGKRPRVPRHFESGRVEKIEGGG